MPETLEPGFLMADSSNLPIVTPFTISDYLTKDKKFTAPECRLAKTTISARESYGDSAIGYVCLRRNGSVCTVKGMICPEQRTNNKDYSVTLKINEKFSRVIDLQCDGCPAAKGGCKHSISFLFWVHRRTESPSPTEVECYWRKSKLSSIGSSLKYILARDIWKRKTQPRPQCLPDNSDFLRSLMEEANRKQLDSQLSRHNFDLESRRINQLSIHQLIHSFVAAQENEKENRVNLLEGFLQYSEKKLTKELCERVEIETRDQSNCIQWFELRYGRITGSKLYEAARCRTLDGSLVNQIIGVAKIPDTLYMARGRALEFQVLTQVGKLRNVKLTKVGLLLIPSLPMLGVSPDAISNDFVLEVKCPAKEETIEAYVKDGRITPKFKAQMMLQMLAADKKKGLFCVADVNFEKNHSVQIIEVAYDENFTKELITRAVKFWEGSIFPRLYAAAYAGY